MLSYLYSFYWNYILVYDVGAVLLSKLSLKSIKSNKLKIKKTPTKNLYTVKNNKFIDPFALIKVRFGHGHASSRWGTTNNILLVFGKYKTKFKKPLTNTIK